MSAETYTPSDTDNKLPYAVWLCFFWINIVPFLSVYRIGPSSGFYLEAASAAGVLCLTLISARHTLHRPPIPALSICLLVLAAYWWLQARLMDLLYPGMNDIVVWSFIILAFAAWSCRSLNARFGQEQVVTAFAWALLAGALMQTVVALIQFSGWSTLPLLKGIISQSNGEVSGQLGQRNHLGHYLMWGILAAAYLHAQRRLPKIYGTLSLLVLTAVLGLVNSRTILGYLIALALILPCWYLYAGKSAKRIVLTLAAAVFLAALFQFSMNTILETLTHIQYETAVERAGSSSFSGSLRQIEWQKAITAFQTAPLFGHGWNSFAQQTFLINAEQHNFTNNILNVLFTHAHNIIFQLLAETGISGTLLVALTLLTGIATLLKKPKTPASLFLLCALSVSLCHSMLEYPLWYLYFLVPFTLMLSLAPAQTSDGILPKKTPNLLITVAITAIAVGLTHMTFTYTQLVRFSRIIKTDTPATVEQKIQGLRHISDTYPMLAYYADLSLSKRAAPTDAYILPWAEQASLKALTYRPYSNTYQTALYLMRQGKTQEAQQWMQATQYYYPYLMPFYTDKILLHPAFKPLLPKIRQDCKTFAALPGRSKAKPCN